jgi:hypothetical protein
MTRREFVAAAASFRLQPAFAGSFLQLYDGHRAWTPAQWDVLFSVFQALGLARIILQWTRYEQSNYAGLLPGIFDRARRANLRVTVGLIHTNAFWSMTEDTRASTLASYFEETERLAGQLAPWTQRAEFDGFYISQEFDDVRWSRKTMRARGGNYLRAQARLLRQVAPRARVAVSAFSNGDMAPRELGRLWKDALQFSGATELLFQDGVGAGKLTIARAGEYWRELGTVLGERLTPVVEAFEMIRADPFEARPASLARLESQLRTAREAGLAEPMVFAVPEYLSPLGGAEAEALFENYRLTK